MLHHDLCGGGGPARDLLRETVSGVEENGAHLAHVHLGGESLPALLEWPLFLLALDHHDEVVASLVLSVMSESTSWSDRELGMWNKQLTSHWPRMAPPTACRPCSSSPVPCVSLGTSAVVAFFFC